MRRAVLLLPFLLAGCSACDDMPWILEWNGDGFDPVAQDGSVEGTYLGHGLPKDADPRLEGGTLFMVQVDTEDPPGFLVIEGTSAHWRFDNEPGDIRPAAQALADAMGLGDGFADDVAAGLQEYDGRWRWDAVAPVQLDPDVFWGYLGRPSVEARQLGQAMARMGPWDVHFDLPVARTDWSPMAGGIDHLELAADRFGNLRFAAYTDFGLGDPEQQATFRTASLDALDAKLDALGVVAPRGDERFGHEGHC